MRTISSMLAVVTLVACGTTTDRDTEVRIHVDIDDAIGGQLLRVRVFDTDRALASDQTQVLLGAERPIVVPVFPETDGERSYHVVMELIGPGAVNLGTQRVIGGYVEGESRVLRVRFSQACAETVCSGRETCHDEAGSASCVHACFDPQRAEDESLPTPTMCPNTVYVDGASGEDDPVACFGPEAPCNSVEYALETYLSDRAGGTINVAGGSTYPGFGFRADNSGTVTTPTVVQAWAGTGRPMFEGDGSRAVIETCCNENSANYLVLDGLEVVGGHLNGILLHGTGVTAGVIRDCIVRGTTLPETVPYDNQAGAIVVTNQASGVSIIGNEVRDNRGTGEFLSGDDPPVRVPIGSFGIALTGDDMLVEDNLVADNAGYGLLIYGNRHRVARNRIVNNGSTGIQLVAADDNIIQDNIICASMRHGIEVFDSQRGQIEHNTILRSGGDGILLQQFSNQWTVSRNIIGFSARSGLSRNPDEESEPTDLQNLYWMNLGGARSSIEADGADWVDDVNPMFADSETCDATVVGDAARLIDGGPVGARPLD